MKSCSTGSTATAAHQRPQELRDATWDRDLGDDAELRRRLDRAELGLSVARHIVGLVSRSSDLNLVAQVAVELHFGEGDRFGLIAAPLIERLEAAMADGELPAPALATLHAASHTEGVFDVDDLADILTTAGAGEQLPALGLPNEGATVF